MSSEFDTDADVGAQGDPEPDPDPGADPDPEAEADVLESLAIVERLEELAARPREDILRFSEFQRETLRRPFGPQLDQNGVPLPDVFRHRIAKGICEDSISEFADALFSAVQGLRGAFAPAEAYGNLVFYEEARRLLRWASASHSRAFFVAVHELWKIADRDLERQRAMCAEQMRALNRFSAYLSDEEAIFFQPEAFQQLVRNPPAPFVASLQSKRVYLSDLANVLPNFISTSVPPVSMRTFQMSAAEFIQTNRTSLQEATQETLSTLKTIRSLQADSPELSSVQTFWEPQTGSVRCPLPRHLYSTATTIHLTAGAYTGLCAAIPSFRICDVLFQLSSRMRNGIYILPTSAMRVHAFVPLVRRLITESESWRPSLLVSGEEAEPEAAPEPPAAPPSPTPSVASVASVGSVASVASRTSLASFASMIPAGPAATAPLSDELYETALAALVRKWIERRLQEESDNAAQFKVQFLEIARQLRRYTGTPESEKAVIQRCAPILRTIAKKADVEIGKIGRNKGFCCSRADMHRLWTATAPS